MPKTRPDRLSLYARVLGRESAQLAPVLARLHDSGNRSLGGILKVRIARGFITRWLLRLTGMPRAAQSAACTVRILPCQGGEKWHRCFDGRSLVSRQYADDDRWIIERIGCLVIHLELQVREDRLRFRSSITKFCGLRLPASLGIQVVAQERAMSPDTFHSDVRVRSPLLGPLLRYSGTLRLEERQPQGKPERLMINVIRENHVVR